MIKSVNIIKNFHWANTKKTSPIARGSMVLRYLMFDVCVT